jgi:chromosome segregation ATPase
MSNCLSESDYDDVPVRATKLLSSLNLGKCSISNSDGSVKKRLSKLPIKRPLDNSDSFHTFVKKPKVYARRLVGRPYSTRMKENIKIELEMVENLIRNCKRTRNAEDEKLQSIERDVEECSKKIRKMKRKATRLRTISQYYNNMQNRIEERVQDLTEKEAQVCLIEDLIKRHNHELEKNKIELRKVEDNNNKDGGRKRSSRVFRKQIDECTKEIKTKEEELDALKIFVRGKIEELQTDRKKLLNVMDKRDKRRADQQMKDFESMKKQDRVTKKQCDRRLKEFHSKEKHFEVQARELES